MGIKGKGTTKLHPLAGELAPREPAPAVIACNDYLRMGPGRSLSKLHAQYCADMGQNRPPTRTLNTLKTWSSRFAWQARAEEYDAARERERQRAHEEARRAVMEEGLALDHERVGRLKLVASDLYEQFFAEEEETGRRPNLWVRDVKQIGSGEFAREVEIERFNAALIEQLRGALDDIAKEKGERVKKQEVSGPGGEEIVVKILRNVSMEDI